VILAQVVNERHAARTRDRITPEREKIERNCEETPEMDGKI
jgi:hypothetical protein